MTLLVLSEHDVRRLLDMESCVETMTEVLTSLARGELYQPLREAISLELAPAERDHLRGLFE